MDPRHALTLSLVILRTQKNFLPYTRLPSKNFTKVRYATYCTVLGDFFNYLKVPNGYTRSNKNEILLKPKISPIFLLHIFTDLKL